MKYRCLKGYKYERLETVAVDTKILDEAVGFKTYIILWEGGRLFIKKRYVWDGASFLTFDTKSSMRGSLVHDALYQLMREGLLDRKWRKHADELLRDICIEESKRLNPGWSLKAKTKRAFLKQRFNVWYFFVRRFGKKSSMPRKKPRGRVIEI